MEEINTDGASFQASEPNNEAIDNEEEFNSLNWLKDNVEQEISEEKEIRRKRRNQRKSRDRKLKKVKMISVKKSKVQARKLLPQRNEACPCGATKNDKPVKYKNCCGRV